MEELKNRLFDAAERGSVPMLHELLEQDPLILERDVSNRLSETPLHVAAMLGHLNFVQEVVRKKPQLANELNSGQSTPLHSASSKGHVEVVKVLLSANPQACLARDRNGMTPLHLAAVKGRIEVMKVLVEEEASDDAASRLTVYGGESIMHLCIKHYQLEALKLLVKRVCGHDRKLINAKDCDENTLLHLAVAYKQVETIEFLVMVAGLDVNAKNKAGMTAADVLIHSRRDTRDAEIHESLKRAGCYKALEGNMDQDMVSQPESFFLDQLASTSSFKKSGGQRRAEWVKTMRNTLMVVASLIATMAFQVGVNPPSGVWQDDGAPTSDTASNNALSPVDNSHVAGKSILGRSSSHYGKFYVVNTVSFVSSLSIILILMSGLPIRSRLSVWALMVVTWIMITGTALTYCLAMQSLTPNQDALVMIVTKYTILAWEGLMGILLVGHLVRLIVRIIKVVIKTVTKLVKKITACCCKSAEGTQSARLPPV